MKRKVTNTKISKKWLLLVLMLVLIVSVGLIIVYYFRDSPNEHSFPLTVELDKYEFCSGETMNITITNVSNETLEFGNDAYNVVYHRWNGTGWEKYDAVPGCAMITKLEPGETAQVTWKLGGRIESPFPPGRYSVGTKDVYAEFDVISGNG